MRVLGVLGRLIFWPAGVLLLSFLVCFGWACLMQYTQQDPTIGGAYAMLWAFIIAPLALLFGCLFGIWQAWRFWRKTS